VPFPYRKARDLAAANNIDLKGMRSNRGADSQSSSNSVDSQSSSSGATTATTSIASLDVAPSSNEATIVI